jgi:hypothetical protein
MAYGELFHVPTTAKGDELENYRLELKAKLIQLREKVDKLARE